MEGDKDITEILKEILKWTKFEGMQKVKGVLESTLNDDVKRLIYELSDGRTSPMISRIVKADPTTVRDYWKKWGVLGIMEIHPKYKKRYRRVFSLKEVGIELPKVEGLTEEEEKTEGEEEENE